jgi:multidrug transporter EmrE-like cation transporter
VDGTVIVVNDNMRLAVFIAIVVLGGTAGDISVSHAMKKIGEVHPLTPVVIARVLGRAFRMGWMWLGIGLMGVAFFSLLALLSWADVSVVVPATALSYVAGALGAKFLLHEKVAPVRWAGVLLVCLGVALISMS